MIGVPALARVAVLATATVLAAGVVAPAFASGPSIALVPDPNFEANCAGVPCDWNGFGATLSRDTSLAQSGSASVRVTASGVSGPAQAVSVCFTGVVGGSSYTLSGFYALTDASITSVELSVNWRFDCGSSNPSASSVSVGPTRDGAFHSLSGSVTAPAGVYAARVNAKFFCSGAMCANGTFARFDDVSLVGSFQPAQDPNFEANCSNVPCDWNGFGATLSRDTSLAQSGSASARVTASGVSRPRAGGQRVLHGDRRRSSYTLSGFYALTDASITSVELSVNWRFDCGSSNPAASDVSVGPTRDGAFHSLSGSVTAPAGAYAALVNAKFFCSGAMCANGIFARFDDVSLLGSFSRCRTRTSRRIARRSRVIGAGLVRR